MATIQPPPPQPPQSLPNPSAHEPLSIIGLILAFLVPPTGVVLSIIALVRIHKNHQKGKILAIIGLVVGVPLTATIGVGVLFFFLLFYVGGGGHSNQAQADMKPIMASLDQISGHKICDNGDNGHTLDNTVPWYEVYYVIPDNSNLTNNVESIASSQEYALKTDTDTINHLQSNDGSQEQFNPNSDYLTAKDGGNTLSITINRQTSVGLDCAQGEYGRKMATGNNKAIIDMSLTLPDTSK